MPRTRLSGGGERGSARCLSQSSWSYPRAVAAVRSAAVERGDDVRLIE